MCVGGDLQGATLRGADLEAANLQWANLRGANLEGGVKACGHVFTKPPVQISDKYTIDIWQGFMVIGCEEHTLSEWSKFTQKRVLEMDGKEGLVWWKKWKEPLMAIAKANDLMELPEKARGE